MLWIALAAAAAQFNAPAAVNILNLYRYEDVPVQSLPHEFDGTVTIRLTVRPDGQVQTCEIEVPTRIRQLDTLTCDIARRRARFAAARPGAGTPTYAVYRARVRWVVTASPDLKQSTPFADLEVRVSRLPPGIKSPRAVSLKFNVDEQGHPSFCSSEELPGRLGKNDPELVRIGCDELLKSYVASPAKDEVGKPVPSLQDAVVVFAAP